MRKREDEGRSKKGGGGEGMRESWKERWKIKKGREE